MQAVWFIRIINSFITWEQKNALYYIFYYKWNYLSQSNLIKQQYFYFEKKRNAKYEYKIDLKIFWNFFKLKNENNISIFI